MDYFYDNQVRRLLLQLVRVFSGIEVWTGIGKDGTRQKKQVPIRQGDMSRMTSHIIRQNSENKILTTPLMAIHIIDVNMSPERRQTPDLVTTHLVDERKFNKGTNEYTSELGDRYTLKRYMPVPYDFTVQLDGWTTNIDQKLQLMEQIMTLFNPSLDLRTSNNNLDWTSLTYIEMLDNITWSSKSIPVGTDEIMDVFSFQFKVPYWINPPAEISQRKAIETIIANIRAVNELPVDDSDFSWESGELLAQAIITPGNHICKVDGNELILLGAGGNLEDDNGNVYSWHDLLIQYSDFVPDHSKITVKRKFGDPTGITGSISFSNEINKLIWEIDELPNNTLSDINGIIDPRETYPGQTNGIFPSNPVNGDRFLIIDEIRPGTSAWGTLTADIGDIIQYNGSIWNVSFDSSESNSQQIVKNVFTGQQLRWLPTEKDWEPAIDGEYKPGTWKVISIPVEE